MVNTTKYYGNSSNFNEESGFSDVVFSESKILLETEINELQHIQNHARREFIRTVYPNCMLFGTTVTYTSSNLNLTNAKFIIDGDIIDAGALHINIGTPGYRIYLYKDYTEINPTSVLKRGGNQHPTLSQTIDNYIKDKRYDEETTGRVQIQYNLVLTTSGGRPNAQFFEVGYISTPLAEGTGTGTHAIFVQTIPIIQPLKSLVSGIEEISVNAKHRGLIANDLTAGAHNKTAFERLFTLPNLDKIKIPAGTYTTNQIGCTFIGKHIQGMPGKTVIQSLNGVAIQMGTSSDTVFEGITFVSLHVGEHIYGIVNSLGAPIHRIKFIRCTFKSLGTNGVKFVNEGSNMTEDVTFEDCIFEDIGRMGVEVQNHGSGGLVRYRNIQFIRCKFKNIGTVYNGMGISTTGVGEDVVVRDCYFDDCAWMGVELIGTRYATVDTCTFIGEKYAYSPINATNANPNDYLTIINNKSHGRLGRINIYNARRGVIANNIFNDVQELYLRNAREFKIVNNIISSKAYYAVFFDNSRDCLITGNTLDTSQAAGNSTVLRFYGTDSIRNRVYNNHLYQGSGGNLISDSNGASNNEVGLNYHHGHTPVTGYSQSNIPQYYETYRTAVGGVSKVAITLVALSSWAPFEFDVMCISVANSGGVVSYTSTKVYGTYHNGFTVASVDTVPPLRASLTTGGSGMVLTLTFTQNDTNSSAGHRWVINGNLPSKATYAGVTVTPPV